MEKIAFEEHFATERLMQMRGEMLKNMGLTINLSQEELKRTAFLACDVEKERIPSMDRSNIAIQVLHAGSNGLEGVADQGEAAALARRFNNYLYDTVQSHPGRFEAFALLPLQAPEAAAEELERCVAELGFKGATIAGRTLAGGAFLDEKPFWCIWERAERLGVPLYIHPTETLSDSMALYRDCEALNGPTWSWGVDTATYVLRFIFTGLFDRFPKVKLIVGHMGEMLPYVLWRMDNRWRIAPQDSRNRREPSAYFKQNIYITMSGNLSSAAMACAIQALGDDRILFAVDYPFESNEEAACCLDQLPISEESRRRVAYENGKKLLYGI